jgi:hypothetical protein
MHTDPGVVFVLFIVGVVMLTAVAYGVLLFARWQADRVRYVPPAPARPLQAQPNDRRFSAVSSAEIKKETGETLPSRADIEQEKVSFAETAVAEALARLVIAEEVDLSKAVKIGAGKKSGEGYQKWSKLVKEAMDRQREVPTPIALRPTGAKFMDN